MDKFWPCYCINIWKCTVDPGAGDVAKIVLVVYTTVRIVRNENC